MARSKKYNITKTSQAHAGNALTKSSLPQSTKSDVLDIRTLNFPEDVMYIQKDSLHIKNIPSKTINRNFGGEGDYIEVYIKDESNNLISRIENFENYEITESNTLSIDPNLILQDQGHTSGKFNITLHLLRNKIFNTTTYPFKITEISPKRREIKSISTAAENNLLSRSVSQFIAEIDSSAYFKEFSLLFSDGSLIPAINIRLNKSSEKYELILKTFNALPFNIDLSDFKIVEEIVDPISLEVDLGFSFEDEDIIELRGPNFEINTRQESSIPSEFKNYDSLLNYNFTSSYQYLLNNLERTLVLALPADLACL